MLLSLTGIQKRFGGVHALRNGTLHVRAGEAHLLMGENGAGKSTLMKIVAGLQTADGGEMSWKGERVSFRSPSEAAAQGIAMVHQESLLAPHLTIAENIYLGRERRNAFGWIDKRAIVTQAADLIAANGFRLDPRSRTGDLTPAGRQLVEICRAIAQGSSLLIFDEPTSSLSEAETREVFRIVMDLKLRNVGVIYITHRLEELRSVGDAVTILRDGSTVHSAPLQDLTREQLIQYMVGRAMDGIYRRDPIPPGETLLRAKNLTRGLLRDVSFELRAGEVVGLAGLMGAGRTELCQILFGIDRPESGSVEICGHDLQPKSPRDSIKCGVALIPEDRQRHGLALRLPISWNVTLPDLDAVSTFGFLRKRAERSLSEEYRTRLGIRASSVQQHAGRLSGGNQQKIVIAKWIARGARVFLFDEPTRGIDISAKQEVFEQIDKLARSGAAVLMVSSELPELLQVTDRILVMREGTLCGELPAQTTQEAIMQLASPCASRTTAA